MSELRDLLLRRSKKVIEQYRLLLIGVKNEKERELYRKDSFKPIIGTALGEATELLRSI
jgi:hypothetical protein